MNPQILIFAAMAIFVGYPSMKKKDKIDLSKTNKPAIVQKKQVSQDLNKEITAKNEKINSLNQELKSLSSQLESLKNKNKSLNDILKKNNNLTDEQIAQLNKSKDKQLQLEKKINEMEKIKKEYFDYKNNSNQKIKLLESEKQKMIAELEKSKADAIKKLASENEKIKSELTKVESKNNFLVKESQKGIKITFLNKVLFDNGKADLKKESLNSLKELAAVLNKYPKRNIIVEGHTDSIPIKNSPYFKSNWELSTARAISVLKYLVYSLKVKKERISVQGYADNFPIGDNSTADGRALNRRVEIILLPENYKVNKIKETIK